MYSNKWPHYNWSVIDNRTIVFFLYISNDLNFYFKIIFKCSSFSVIIKEVTKIEFKWLEIHIWKSHNSFSTPPKKKTILKCKRHIKLLLNHRLCWVPNIQYFSSMKNRTPQDRLEIVWKIIANFIIHSYVKFGYYFLNSQMISSF